MKLGPYVIHTWKGKIRKLYWKLGKKMSCDCKLIKGKIPTIELCEEHTAWEVYGDYEGRVEQRCNELLNEEEK